MCWSTEAEARERFRAETVRLCPECGAAECYLLCSRHPDHYSLAQELEDTRWNDSLSHDEWFRLAVVQYEAVHGESYCS